MPWRTTASHPDTDSVLWHLARIEQASSLNTSLSVMIINCAKLLHVISDSFLKTMNVVMVPLLHHDLCDTIRTTENTAFTFKSVVHVWRRYEWRITSSCTLLNWISTVCVCALVLLKPRGHHCHPTTTFRRWMEKHQWQIFWNNNAV